MLSGFHKQVQVVFSIFKHDATAVISVKLELPETSVNHGNNTNMHRKHFVLFRSILWNFSQTLSWRGHAARPSDAMQMLPWPWPPAHTMLGPTWHRCRATFSLGQPGAALCRMWTVPTILLCSLFTLSRFSLAGFNETLPWFLQSHTAALSLMLYSCAFPFFFHPPPYAFSPIRTLLILCRGGVFSNAISWPGACALLSLGWVCLVDCSTGTDWHSSWGLQGLHTQPTKHVSVWEAALLLKYEVCPWYNTHEAYLTNHNCNCPYYSLLLFLCVIFVVAVAAYRSSIVFFMLCIILSHQ